MKEILESRSSLRFISVDSEVTRDSGWVVMWRKKLLSASFFFPVPVSLAAEGTGANLSPRQWLQTWRATTLEGCRMTAGIQFSDCRTSEADQCPCLVTVSKAPVRSGAVASASRLLGENEVFGLCPVLFLFLLSQDLFPSLLLKV